MTNLEVKLDFRASQSLSLECLRNEIARIIQVGRKTANLEITDKPAVGFYCTNPYICAAARLHKEYIIEECLLERLVITEGKEDTLVINHLDLPLDTKRWHTPVSIVNGELYYGTQYAHYWEALEAWNKTK